VQTNLSPSKHGWVADRGGNGEKPRNQSDGERSQGREKKRILKNKTPRTRFESPRRLLISPPPSAAQTQCNAEPAEGKWLPSAMYGTNVVGVKECTEVIDNKARAGPLQAGVQGRSSVSARFQSGTHRGMLFTRNSIPLPPRMFRFPRSDRSEITPTGALRPAWTMVASGKP
jgi:hypothetical protein